MAATTQTEHCRKNLPQISSSDFLMYIQSSDRRRRLSAKTTADEACRTDTPKQTTSRLSFERSDLFERGDYKFVARDFRRKKRSGSARKADKLGKSARVSPQLKSKDCRRGYLGIAKGGRTRTLLWSMRLARLANGGHGHADALAINLAVAGRRNCRFGNTPITNQTSERFFRRLSAQQPVMRQIQSSGREIQLETKSDPSKRGFRRIGRIF